MDGWHYQIGNSACAEGTGQDQARKTNRPTHRQILLDGCSCRVNIIVRSFPPEDPKSEINPEAISQLERLLRVFKFKRIRH